MKYDSSYIAALREHGYEAAGTNLVDDDETADEFVTGVLKKHYQEVLKYAEKRESLLMAYRGKRIAELEKAATQDDQMCDQMCDQIMAERDRAVEFANSFSQHIESMTGQEFGEHSSCNCPWDNCTEFIEQHPMVIIQEASDG